MGCKTKLMGKIWFPNLEVNDNSFCWTYQIIWLKLFQLQEPEEVDIDLSDPDLNKAATKIQASFRGHRVRKEVVPEIEVVATNAKK